VKATGRRPQRAPDGSLSTTSATARTRPRCTACWSSTPRPSSPRPKTLPVPNCRNSVKDEFDAFLECGILGPRLPAPALRRLRPRQADRLQLQATRVLPLVRGLAHAQTAVHLVDQVSPHMPVRRWVLSLPIPLRLLLAAQPKLVTPVLHPDKERGCVGGMDATAAPAAGFKNCRHCRRPLYANSSLERVRNRCDRQHRQRIRRMSDAHGVQAECQSGARYSLHRPTRKPECDCDRCQRRSTPMLAGRCGLSVQNAPTETGPRT